VIGGKKVEGSEASNVMAVTFSPDGKRYAATCQTSSSTQFVVADGKRGQEYATIQNVAFSPDSSRCSYGGMMNGKTFVVIDGEESDGYAGIPEIVFGGGGKHVGYLAISDSQRLVVVDGAAKKWNQMNCGGFAFSGDGSHYAFTTGGGAVQHVVLDGVENAAIQSMQLGSTLGRLPPWFVFGPDGKHLAVFGSLASKPDASTLGLYVDGKRVSAGANFSNVTFSPDGKHLAWSAFDPDGQHRAVYYDGKRCAQFDVNGPLAVDARTWEMGADGALTTLGPDGERIQRVRITPSADASVETMTANAAK
jgi:WD40 repeat protein